MRLKLSLLVLFTAIVSVACAGTTDTTRKGTPMGEQKPPMKSGRDIVQSGSYKPITLHRTDRVFGGRCEARLTFDPTTGDVTDIATDPPCVVGKGQLVINGHEVVDLSGSITFGGSCKIYYGSAGQYIIDPTKNC